MKKFLILMLVLGLATVANAGLIFTIDGEPQPPEITLEVSEAVELDLELGAGQTIRAYDLVYSLSNAQAELITTGGYGYPATTFPAPFELMGYVAAAAPQSVRISATQMFAPDLVGPQTLMLDLVLHCLEETDVTLTVTTISAVGNFWDGEEIPPGTVVHTLLIHQIPEPMTVVLLGLGGLLLRRRK